MDPFSAVLAVTGLSASLLTIADVILEVSKKLVRLQQKFKDAPKRITQLHDDLRNLQALVVAIQAQSSADEYPAMLQVLCESFTAPLERELRVTETIIDRSYNQLNVSHTKGFKAKVRHVLAEGTIDELHGKISMYVGYLSMVLILINNHKVDHLQRDTLESLNEARALFRFMSSQLQIPQPTKLQQRKLSASGSEEHVSNKSEQGQLSLVEISGKGRIYDFGFGLLSVHQTSPLNQPSRIYGRDGLRLKAAFVPPSWISRTALCATIHFPGQAFRMNSWPSIVLQPTTINQSPKLLEALHRLDFVELRRLFETNQARPTDMVMDLQLNEPVTLSDAILFLFSHVSPCSSGVSKHKGLMSFLISQGISPSAEAAMVFFLFMDRSWAYDQPQQLLPSANYYLKALLDCGTISLDTVYIPSRYFVPPGWYSYRYGESAGKTNESILPALVEGLLGFEGLKNYLFHQSQSWSLEELSGRGLWYVAVLAHVDEAFRKALRAHIWSFRSIITADRENSLDILIASVFDIEKISNEVVSATLKERGLFIKTLCSKGSATMLNPFLEGAIDLDEGKMRDNYLGTAAANVNMEVFKLLLAACASTASAIPQLCDEEKMDSQVFEQLLSELVENLDSSKSHSLENDSPDALTAVIESDRAVTARPDALQLLLRNNFFLAGKLHGSDYIYPCHSYIFGALCYNRIDFLEGLLEHDPPLDRMISDMFATDREHFQSISRYNWLTLAVELGRSDCVRLILARTSHQEQAIIYPDGAGRTALQIAHSSVGVSHPRKSVLNGLHWVESEERALVSLAEDDATLQIIQTALDADDSILPSSESNTDGNKNLNVAMGPVPPLRSYLSIVLEHMNTLNTRTAEIMGELLYFSPKAFTYSEVVIHCRASQCLTCTRQQRQALWRSQWTQLSEMTFLEAFLLRMSYILMIGMIVVCEFAAMCISFKELIRLPRPSWVVISLTFILLYSIL